jgi:hypothetical protein
MEEIFYKIATIFMLEYILLEQHEPFYSLNREYL